MHDTYIASSSARKALHGIGDALRVQVKAIRILVDSCPPQPQRALISVHELHSGGEGQRRQRADVVLHRHALELISLLQHLLPLDFPQLEQRLDLLLEIDLLVFQPAEK